MRRPSISRPVGFSFLELICATAMMVFAVVLLVGSFALQYRDTQAGRAKTQALRIANQVLAACRHQLRDGRSPRELADPEVGSPDLGFELGDAPLQNRQYAGGWLWLRRLRVEALPGGEGHYEALVEVRRRQADGEYELLATLAGPLREPEPQSVTRRCYDLYLLAIENLPGVGVDTHNLRAWLEAQLDAFETDNPGVELRPHWITRMSEGRRDDYLPALGAEASEWVYGYPDLQPERLKARHLHDGRAHRVYDPNLNPDAYALADRHNPALRLPEERERFARRLAQVRARQAAMAQARREGRGLPPLLRDMSAEPSWRLLLEDLNRHPARYQDALLLNLHGDLLPLPPLCNIASPAADPKGLPGLRCVAHFEELRTRRGARTGDHDDAVLRVYAFGQRGAELPGDGICPSDRPIALRVFGVDLCDSEFPGRLRPGVELQNLVGGVPVVFPGTKTPNYNYRPFAPAKDLYQPRGDKEMFYAAWFVDPGFGLPKHTLILLFHTPLIAPQVRNSGSWLPQPLTAPRVAESLAYPPQLPLPRLPGQGGEAQLQADPCKGALQGLGAGTLARPLGLAYNPSPLDGRSGFGRDLASPGPGPKNSARWRLRIPGTALDRDWFVGAEGRRDAPGGTLRLRVETEFWSSSPVPRGPAVPRRGDGRRSSNTYTWWAEQAAAVPFTERAQVMGDPRHNPYKDLCAGDPDFGGRLNQWFGLRPSAVAGYQGIDPGRLPRGWSDGSRVDVPELLGLLRRGLQRSRIRFAGLGAVRDQQVALGGEAADRDSWVGRGPDAGGFVALPWLGDLAPDTDFVREWQRPRLPGRTWGNLRRGAGLLQMRTGPAGEVLARAGLSGRAQGLRPTLSRRWRWGSLFMPSKESRRLELSRGRGLSLLTKDGLALEDRFARRAREQTIVESVLVPGRMSCDPSWSWPRWQAERSELRLLQRLAEVSEVGRNTPCTWGVLAWQGPGEERAYYCFSGLRASVLEDTGRSLIALLAAIDETPGPALPDLNLLPPRRPDLSRSLILSWDLEAEAGKAQSEGHFAYRVLVSTDGGKTYADVRDGAPVQLGHLPDPETLIPDQGPGPEHCSWVPPPRHADHGPRHALLRVEAWRRSGGPHNVWRERRIHVPR